MENFPTDEIKDYRCLRKLGEGAAGKVYLVTPTSRKNFAIPGDLLALKLYKPEILKEPDEQERIKREFEVGSVTSHPNVVRIHEFSPGSTPYLVMEYVDGDRLDEFFRMYHPISDKLLLNIVQQLNAGLDCLHDSHVIHRDIKPQNVMITSSFRAKIMDLGVARITTDVSITPLGAFLGTVRYSSPEMLFGKPYDKRTDLYSLGAVIYALLHGEDIFAEEGNNYAGLYEKVRNGYPQYDDSLETTSEVYKLLLKLTKSLLQKEPNDRLESIKAVIGKLEEVRGVTGEPSEPLHGYIATALTGLERDAKENIAFVSSKIAEACKAFDIYVHQPRKVTDPIMHSDIAPETVYFLDRKRAVEADVLIILANSPSFGTGQELEIAGSRGTPIILVAREGLNVSRMVRGSHANFMKPDIVYTTPEDLGCQLRKCLSNNINKLRDWKRNIKLTQQICTNLVQFREVAGYSIEDAAYKLGISHSLLRSAERDTISFHNVGLDIILRICNLYNKDIKNIIVEEIPSAAKQVKENGNIRRLEMLAKKMEWPSPIFFELRDEYMSEVATSGALRLITEKEWFLRFSALEKRRYKEKSTEGE